MALTLVVRLFLLALFVADAFVCNEQNRLAKPWRVLKEFNHDQLKGPPATTRRQLPVVYDLIDQYKTGEEVIFNLANIEGSACLEFDYYLNVPTTSKWGLHLVVVDLNSNKTQTLFSRYGYYGDIWRKITNLKIHLKKDEILQFRALTISGTIAFTAPQNDVTFTRCATSNYDTDFENDNGNWQTIGDVVTVARDVSANTKDHSSDSENGKVAVLRHPTRIFTKTAVRKTVKCMTFWYQFTHAANNTPTHIDLLLDRKVLWKSSDKLPQIGKWAKATVPLHLVFAGNYLTFETVQNSNDSESAVLIDDIQFSNYACSQSSDCFFSDSTCDWTNAYYDEPGLKWILGNGRVMGRSYTVNHLKVPIAFDTIYTDFTANTPNTSPVEIRSGFLQDSDEYCATIHIFYNRIQIGDVFSLIHIIETKEYEEKTNLWQLNSSKAHVRPVDEYTEEWIDVQIPHSVFPRQIALSALSSYPTSRMAVRGIKLNRGHCQTVSTTTSSSL